MLSEKRKCKTPNTSHTFFVLLAPKKNNYNATSGVVVVDSKQQIPNHKKKQKAAIAHERLPVNVECRSMTTEQSYNVRKAKKKDSTKMDNHVVIKKRS